MPVAAATNLACPIDGLPLRGGPPLLKCVRGHAYDRAKEGYWNLLLVQHKASRQPGDAKDMVAARRRVLDAGFYMPLVERIATIIAELAAHARPHAPFRIIDAGCGEGHVLHRLAERLAASTCDIELAGTDVSKPAVQAAAKRGGPIAWAVANNRHLPFEPESVDLIMCVMGYPVWDGFTPVLRDSGRVLLVDPGPEHLVELRSAIYPELRRSGPPSLDAALAAGYRSERDDALSYRVSLESQAAVQDLFSMTPHATRAPAAGREALARLERLDVTVDVALRLLAR